MRQENRRVPQARQSLKPFFHNMSYINSLAIEIIIFKRRVQKWYSKHKQKSYLGVKFMMVSTIHWNVFVWDYIIWVKLVKLLEVKFMMVSTIHWNVFVWDYIIWVKLVKLLEVKFMMVSNIHWNVFVWDYIIWGVNWVTLFPKRIYNKMFSNWKS